MVASHYVALDEVGSLDAESGTRSWSLAVKSRMSAALKDERMSADHLKKWMDLFRQHKGYRALANSDGEIFETFESFCRCPTPHGLGYDLDAINAIIEERKTAESRATAPKLLMTYGGDRKSEENQANNTNLNRRHGTSAEYLTARIARDHPDVLKRMKAGEFNSVRAAALAAQIIKPYASVRIDDPDAMSAFLAKHFDPADIRKIADLAIHLREGG